jgi:hypothetical protein
MPYTMCPICGSLSHLNVGDLKDWYAKRGVPFGSLLPAKCCFCWKEIRVGDVVVLRSFVTPKDYLKPGEKGVVKAVLESEDGLLFEVRMPNGKEYLFVRAEIRPLLDREIESDSSP